MSRTRSISLLLRTVDDWQTLSRYCARKSHDFRQRGYPRRLETPSHLFCQKLSLKMTIILRHYPSNVLEPGWRGVKIFKKIVFLFLFKNNRWYEKNSIYVGGGPYPGEKDMIIFILMCYVCGSPGMREFDPDFKKKTQFGHSLAANSKSVVNSKKAFLPF